MAIADLDFSVRSQPLATLAALLADALDSFTVGSVRPGDAGWATARAMAQLAAGLADLWRTCPPADWAEVVAVSQQHPLYALLAQDPFTQRARTKPRGYAGDAVMIDYIYRGLTAAERAPVTELGQAIFGYTAGLSRSARSVRARRDMLAARIDATAERVKRPRILSVACGHLREAASSRAVLEGRIGSLCALDQDAASLAVVHADYGHLPGVEVIAGSVRDLLNGALTVSAFDLIYAGGLFDYLPQPVARSLVRVLGAGLCSGGALVIGNFLPVPAFAGYMEAMMAWPLLWRTQAELASLVDAIPRADIAESRSYLDADAAVAYVEVVRR